MTKRSGSNIPDSRRSELGFGRITLRLPLATLARLTGLAKAAGQTRAQFISATIDRMKAKRADS